MRLLLSLLILASSPVLAQGPAQVSSDTVVATINGRKVNAGELEKIVAALPTQNQQFFNINRKDFVRQLALQDGLAKAAEQAKLDKESPFKERIEMARTQILAVAMIDKAYKDALVQEADIQKYYDQNKDRYTQAKLRVVYLSYLASPPAQPDPKAKKILNEAEARAKAEQLVKELRAGADFAKLAKENSDDRTSGEKGGDYGVVKKSDSLPEDVKKVIFALPPKGVSDPVKQPNGFYVFQVDEVAVEPFAKVKDDIFRDLKQAEAAKWMDEARKKVDVKFDNEAYFAQPATPSK
jgi:parvulin-like peptidyl-prolyl isomerase